jgi:cytochrome c biogenesis protein CcmG/thiol:disulfide interchange protein DsbE
MKRFSLLVFLVLIATGCSTPKSTTQVTYISCDSITKQEGSSVPILKIELPCSDGKSQIKLNEIKGPAIINAWASWCAPCKEEIPIFKEFAELAQGQIQLVGIDVEERSLVDGAKFVTEMGMTWPQLVDNDGRTRAAFGMGIPVTWFINDRGEIVYEKVGPIRSIEQMRGLVQNFLRINI